MSAQLCTFGASDVLSHLMAALCGAAVFAIIVAAFADYVDRKQNKTSDYDPYS